MGTSSVLKMRAAIVAGAVFAVTIAAGVTTGSSFATRPNAAGPDDLGLPPLSEATSYILAPPSRTVLPTTVQSSTPVNADFVTASSSTSERDGHDLQADPTSDTTKLDGTTVRRAGSGEPGAAFSYLMHTGGGSKLTLRVEEAGSASSDYDVLVNGSLVYHRAPDDAFGAGRPIGLEHYSVAVPTRLVRGETVRVEFRNRAKPGDGARIASVWLSGTGGRPAAPYGGTATNPTGAISGGTTTLSTAALGRPYVVYDFGREVGGTVKVKVKNSGGAPRLGLAFSESQRFMTTTSDFSQDPSGVATETHYFTPAAGTSTIDDPVIRGGFRYLMVFLASPGSVTLSDLELKFTADPTNPNLRDYKGAFLSSDDTLNKMWYSGAYTVQMSTIDSHTGRPYPAQPGPVRNDELVAQGDSFISDGAKRDRYDWGGDNVISNPIAYLSTGLSEPARNSLEWFSSHPSEAGQVPGVYLPEPNGFNYSWGEYAAWWVNNYWTHYLYTGDKPFLDRWFQSMQNNIAWFESSVGTDGLWDVPGNAGGHWGYDQSGKETYDNAVYVWALHAAAQVARAEGDGDLANRYEGFADRTAAAVNRELWDSAAGAYRVKPGVDAHPLDGNAMAVAAGIATGERADSALSFIERELATPAGDLAVDTTAGNAVPRYISPFVGHLELLAYSARETVPANQEAMDVLRRTWEHMLKGDTTSTFWETVSPTGGLGLASYTSLSHGWAAGPTLYLTNQVLGVRPTAGGFSTFEVLPHPDGSLQWAQGLVPTPHGDITSAWKQGVGTFVLDVDAPAGTSYNGGVPADRVSTVEVNGELVWENGKPTSPDVELAGGYVKVSGLSGHTRLNATYGN